MKKKYFFEVLTLIILVASNLILFFQNQEIITFYTREDGIVENLSAIFYVLSAVILFYLFVKSYSANKTYFLKTKRNYFYLLLGLFFIFCAGEEISWGQRIFNISTPEYLEQVNTQKELNLHNLGFIENNDNATGLKHLFTSAGIFVLFCLLYCVIVPLLDKFSEWAHKLINKMSLPVIPIWIGFLFVFNQVICSLIKSAGHIRGNGVTETKEMNFAILFFIAIISLYNIFKNSRLESEKTSN